MRETIYCAIGDIHGELDLLVSLHGKIEKVAAEAFPGRPITFVHLGDLIDRGENSCGVIDYLISHEGLSGGQSITLRGNHEQMMLDALRTDLAANMNSWLRNGGEATLASYESEGHVTIPERHLDWLAGLPNHFFDETAGLFFVHAGVDPALFPDCDAQVRLWTRQRAFFDPQSWTAPALADLRIIHGHTPTDDSFPDVSPCRRRVNIDTGAVYGGRLTAVILAANEEDIFLHA